ASWYSVLVRRRSGIMARASRARSRYSRRVSSPRGTMRSRRCSDRRIWSRVSCVVGTTSEARLSMVLTLACRVPTSSSAGSVGERAVHRLALLGRLRDEVDAGVAAQQAAQERGLFVVPQVEAGVDGDLHADDAALVVQADLANGADGDAGAPHRRARADARRVG